MNASAKWQEVIAENMAASSVPGARRLEVSFAAVEAGVAQAGTAGANQHFLITSPRTQYNLEQGTLYTTDKSTDLALEGPGYFAVNLPDGSNAYTRSGEFRCDSSGRLITKHGFEVQVESGSLTLDQRNLSAVKVAANGDVSQGGEVKGRLRISEFVNPRQLENMGGGYYISKNPDAEMVSDPSTIVRQGCLEGSNISPMIEMATMITSMRMFEANQRTLQAQDERLGRVITELGNPA
jgi:flagellar basal-body rod protein FlgG